MACFLFSLFGREGLADDLLIGVAKRGVPMHDLPVLILFAEDHAYPHGELGAISKSNGLRVSRRLEGTRFSKDLISSAFLKPSA